LILESSFLIDLERERKRGMPGPASRFLERQDQRSLCVTTIIAGEMAAGAETDERPEWERFLHPFQVLPHTRDVCWTYSRLYRELRQRGRSIGSNDLWIAAAALVHGKAVVTSNVDHFGRIPGLEIVAYRT
jgi:tRNA(fMet)-specific endonuclease VapC